MSLSDNYTVDVTQGNGSTDTFTGNWSPLNSSFMRVYLELISTGAQTLQVLDTDYTLSFTSSGYSVVFTTPPSSLYNVIRSREIALTQENPFRTSTGFQGLVHENAFDKLTAITQEIKEAQDRKIGFALGSSSTATVPEPVANNLLGWNSAATNLENKVPADLTSLATVSAFMATLLDDSDAATARATLGAAALAVANTFTATQTLTGAAQNLAAEVDVASATTTDIGAAASNNVRITGTTTITGLGTAAAGITRNIRFAGALTLTHNGTSLILPGGANITTAANDTATALSLGSGNWVVTNYKKQSGLAVIGSSFKVGSFTFDMTSATGTVAITGVGFQPRLLLLFGTINATVAASFGASDGTSQFEMYLNDGGTTDNWSSGTTLIATILPTTGNFQQFALNSFDADGFTLGNTKTNTPTGTARFYYVAMR